jgi:hypothetical protein
MKNTSCFIRSVLFIFLFLYQAGKSFQLVSRNPIPSHSTASCNFITQVQKPVFLTSTALKMGDDGDDARNLPFLASAVLVTAILASWPLLSFFRDTNNPTDGFDIDMFMALKGMLDSSSNGGSMMADDYETILQLPSLSPAEQLVGAIFGPPR